MRNFKLPTKEDINRVFGAFSKKERIIFACLSAALVISTLFILQSINKSLMVRVPFEGGSVSEGIVGSPRFINPALASSSADLDMVALVYSGLLRKSDSGGIIPDLAETYSMSPDGLTYTFTLKDEIYFHNGEPVTPDDVIFTIDRVKNSVIPSPQKVNWDGVTAAKADEKTITFSLRQPNPNFLTNATLGILPRSLWESGSMELNVANTMPVGSGPYQIEEVSKESSGVINSYRLAANSEFALGKPFIEEIRFYFYPNEEMLTSALLDGTVDQISSVTPELAVTLKEKNYKVLSQTLPRVFGLYFNQNENQLFTDKSVTRAIAGAIDKEKIVREILRGYGVIIDSPLPLHINGESASSGAERPETAKIMEDLAKAGWKKGPDGYLEKTITDKNKKKVVTKLAFSISTSNASELSKTAELIQKDLAAVGMKVDIKTFEIGNLNQSVIRPRTYDALLFGQVVSRPSDLFAFWHSSQRKDPGQNIAMYTNATADDLLEDAFVTVNEESRRKKYAQFESEVKKDLPAVFLYSPEFIYVVSKDLQGLALDRLANPADRFASVHTWFTKTEDVWKVFAH